MQTHRRRRRRRRSQLRTSLFLVTPISGMVLLASHLMLPSLGTVIYNDPIPFFDPESNVAASFSTRFTFSVTNVNPSSFGDGLTFFLSQDNLTLGSPGGFLGLVNSSQLTENKFVAIEFDTRLDAYMRKKSILQSSKITFCNLSQFVQNMKD